MMNYEQFYDKLGNRPTDDVKSVMHRAVKILQEREPRSFSNCKFESEDDVILHAKEAQLELEKLKIAKDKWIKQAVYSKFGTGSAPPSDLDMATTALFQQSRVADFVKYVSKQVDVAVKDAIAFRANNKTNGHRGEEEYKQTIPSKLLSNATSALRDSRHTFERTTTAPPPLQLPSNQQNPLFHPKNHYNGGRGGGAGGGNTATTPGGPLDLHREAQEHQARIDRIAEEQRQRRAALHQESLQSSAHSAQCTRQTLLMPVPVSAPSYGYSQQHNQSNGNGHNGHRPPPEQIHFPPSSPPRAWTPNGNGFGHNGGGRGRGNGRGNGNGNGYGHYSDQNNGHNGNGKRPFESNGAGRGGGNGPPRQLGRFE